MKILKLLGNAIDSNNWAERIGTKTGAYDKAHNSRLAKWVWQLGPCLLLFILLEFMTMLPW